MSRDDGARDSKFCLVGEYDGVGAVTSVLLASYFRRYMFS
jgi:hypothetical protein